MVLFALGLNGSYVLLAEGTYHAADSVSGLDIEVDMEKSRKPTRAMVAYPINVNFFHKAFFKTDKVSMIPGNTRNGPCRTRTRLLWKNWESCPNRKSYPGSSRLTTGW